MIKVLIVARLRRGPWPYATIGACGSGGRLAGALSGLAPACSPAGDLPAPAGAVSATALLGRADRLVPPRRLRGFAATATSSPPALSSWPCGGRMARCAARAACSTSAAGRPSGPHAHRRARPRRRGRLRRLRSGRACGRLVRRALPGALPLRPRRSAQRPLQPRRRRAATVRPLSGRATRGRRSPSRRGLHPLERAEVEHYLAGETRRALTPGGRRAAHLLPARRRSRAALADGPRARRSPSGRRAGDRRSRRDLAAVALVEPRSWRRWPSAPRGGDGPRRCVARRRRRQLPGPRFRADTGLSVRHSAPPSAHTAPTASQCSAMRATA